MRRIVIAWAIVLCCATTGRSQQDANSPRLSDSEAVQVLTSLIPPGKKSANLRVLILGNWVKNESTGTICSANGTFVARVNDNNTVTGNSNDTQDCSDTYHHSRLLRLALADPQDPKNSAYIIDSAVFPKGLTGKQMGI